MLPMEDRRKLKRIRVDLPVHVQLLNESNVAISKNEKQGMLYDFSGGGCAFHHVDKFPVGDRLQLRIELNDELSQKYSMKELTVRGTVVRSARLDDGYMTSVQFTIDR